MPAFNEARNLGSVVPHVLAALAALSPTVELIVIDDGSRDDTREVAQGLARVPAAQAASLKLQGLWKAVYTRPAPDRAPDVDEDLYGGFIGQGDRRTLDRLRALSPAQLADKAAGQRLAFEDARLEELLFRFRARNFPDTLQGDEPERWRQHCVNRLHDGAGGGLSLAQFFERIDALSEAADERGQHILGELYDWAEQIAPEAA